MAMTSLTELYTPNSFDQSSPAVIGFIDLADAWNEQMLVELKTAQNLQAMFGLQTTEYIDRFDVLNGVIACSSVDTHLVMGVFESILHQRETLNEDLREINKAFSSHYAAKFIKANTTKNQPRLTIANLMNQVPKDKKVEFMMLNAVSEGDLSFDEFNEMVKMIESRTTEDYGFFYQGNTVEDVDACWMGAIYIANV